MPDALDISYSLVPLSVLQLFAAGLGFSLHFTLVIVSLHAERNMVSMHATS